MPLLLRSGQLHLFWVEVDGKPAVAKYSLLGNDATYSYQSGVNPDCMNDSPGRLGNLFGLTQALALGHRAFDLLRGDEPYKAHLRAHPRTMMETRVAAARLGARLRWMEWVLGSRVKRWAKRVLRRKPAAPSAPEEPEQDASRKAASPSDAGQPELVAAAEDR
jgi:CelD/BcsL family acetyltransferase involved in cellulose biosynthesis